MNDQCQIPNDECRHRTGIDRALFRHSTLLIHSGIRVWSFLGPSALGILIALAIASSSAVAEHPNPAKPDDPNLRLVHTHHYDIHTDMDEPVISDLSARMDVMYDQYQKTFSDFKPPQNAPPLAVYLFATHEKYMAFTDYSGVNTGGLFVNGRHPYLTAYEQGQGRDALRRTLQHEAFHQFAHSTISRHLPPWMNEGMAQVFEESIWVGKNFLTDQIPPRRLRQLHVDIVQKRLIDFDQFMAMTPGDWRDTLHTNLPKAGTCYNQAWAMAAFCSSAGDPVYQADFVKLLHKLHDDNADLYTATHQCFPDIKDFRKKFNAWAAKLQPTPQATLLERQDTLADFLLTFTQKNHPAPPSMAAFHNLVIKYNLKIEYSRGSVTYTTAENPQIYFQNSDNKDFTIDELFFKPNPDAPLPDIICQPPGSEYRYRTHFYISGGKTEHEMLIESTNDEIRMTNQ
jgi:hypothetical protein